MIVEPFVPDAPAMQKSADRGDAGAFGKLLDDLGGVLDRAERSEDALAAGRGDLQDAAYERARADVALSIATAAAQRTAAALTTVLGMQV
ncbi:MAG TPA: hypothetical protein VIG32_04190 [Candidatus Baltobacteraceae bacterium]|jgi:flagellar hook-basal body complex protein FliE